MCQPTFVVRTDQPYVTIPIEVTLKEWGRANALFDELFEWLTHRRIEPAGPPFFRYWVMGGMDSKFGLEAGVPVKSTVGGDGRVFADTIAGGVYATLIHKGHPDRLPESHAVLQEWAAGLKVPLDRAGDGGREVWGGLYEFYLTDPAAEPDLKQWSIEIACRINLFTKTYPARR